jgi:palmitoyltransferase
MFTSLALAIMLATTVKTWIFNCTMIEGWQVERHEAVMERGGRDWWDVKGPDGKKIRIERTEFPYDIGILANMSQAMGSTNFLLWFSPFANGPKVGDNETGCGWTWEENGFNRSEGMWPPPDPEKLLRGNREWPAARRDFDAELRELDTIPVEEQKRAFKERQAQDMRRRKHLLVELEEVDDYDVLGADNDGNGSDEAVNWTNDDGERLQDYGVDEDTEGFYATQAHQGPIENDDVPLAELLRRRKLVHNRQDE